MESNITRDLAALTQMSVSELRGHYARVFGEPTASHNRIWLLRRIAWRIQALAEGGLSERARRRAAELANDADLRLSPPRKPRLTAISASAAMPDDPCPKPGTIIRRLYKGTVLEVAVLVNGFEYQGRIFRSLSAVAKHITGSHCSGYGFFQLRQEAS